MCDHDAIIDTGKRIFQMRKEIKAVSFERGSESELERQEVDRSSKLHPEEDFQAEYTRLCRITWEVDHPSPVTVRASQDIRIPVNSKVLISGCLSGPWKDIEGPLIIQGLDKVCEKQSVRFARGVVNPEPEVPLRVINLSNEDKCCVRDGDGRI